MSWSWRYDDGAVVKPARLAGPRGGATARWRGAAGAVALAAGLAACTNVNVPLVGTLSDDPSAQRLPTTARPQADARGVISYPNYQVAVARPGDTVASVAGRLELSPEALARTNGLPLASPLRGGELLLLPERVAAVPEGTEVPGADGEIDVTVLAGDALDRAEGRAGGPSGAPARAEPRRHRVQPGETAYSIARRYGVTVAALSEWNGLDDNLTLRDGQTLLIPTALPGATTRTAEADPAAPGQGSVTPEPPSAATAQPAEDLPPAAEAEAEAQTATAAGAGLEDERTAASDTARLSAPVSGRIVRGYNAGTNEGLDFAAAAGTPVRAADAGTVAAITEDVDEVPILVLRHEGGLLTVYANVDDIEVAKGATVGRGEQIATVRQGDPSFLHFEVRQGFDSVDPTDYLSD